jgi:YihY family inner membrane protein
VKRILGVLDRFQQRHTVLAFPYAVYQKFSDDQAGNLAALVAYYAFFSVFPLLLALTTILGYALQGDPALEHRVFSSVLGQFPIIGQHSRFHPLTGNLPALVLGLALGIWSGLGVANAAQNAFNTVYEIPRADRPGFLPRVARSLGLVTVGGLGFAATTAVSSVVTSAGRYGLHLGVGLEVAGAVVSAVLDTLLFLALFGWLTGRHVSRRQNLPGAVISGVAWVILQLAGGALLAHKLNGAKSTYGDFAFVIGLLGWFYLQAQVVLYAAEVNVVRQLRLWPRALFGKPSTDADYRSYATYPKRERMAHADQQQVDVRFPADSRPGDEVGVS